MLPVPELKSTVNHAITVKLTCSGARQFWPWPVEGHSGRVRLTALKASSWARCHWVRVIQARQQARVDGGRQVDEAVARTLMVKRTTFERIFKR